MYELIDTFMVKKLSNGYCEDFIPSAFKCMCVVATCISICLHNINFCD